MLRRLTLAALTVLATTSLHAQQRVRVSPDIRKGVININPFALFAEYIAGDVEVKASRSFTIGGGLSYVGISDFNNYRAFEVKTRYYPGEKALQGFSVAATAGFASGESEEYNGVTGAISRRLITRPTFGTELSYQWILGPAARFVAVTGVGLKRYYGAEGRSDPLNVPILPTARVNIGYAF